jgi:excinuclease ABC subunit C
MYGYCLKRTSGGKMFNIEEELKKLPHKPGVYVMRDKEDNIIYVGKAISLRNRVRQYFRKNNKTERIKKMVSLIDHFEYIVVDNEAEALILECNLIKKNRPKFNVLLKDDKTYPYIKIDLASDYPGVFITRRIIKDGSKYFGPYANPGAAKEMVNFIKEKYKIRQCRTLKERTRPCLNYHIKKCLAPCMGYVTKEEYRKQINEIIDLLEGKTDKLIKELKLKMKKASEELDFERAAYIRDKIQAIERVSEKQKVSNISENNIDVIGIAKSELEICIEIFFVRGSKMIGREHYFYTDLKDMEEAEVLSGFIKQYYMDNPNIPNKIMIREELEDKQIIEQWLSTMLGKKVEIKHPQKGEKLRFVEMAENNAKVTLENKEKDKTGVLMELKQVLNLEKLPRKIETFDISNLSGEYMVAGMCVMQDGVIKKNLSRRFKIKTVHSQDDPRCMEEVIIRRLKHSLDTTNGGFGELPDVIFADGGITQIRAVQNAIIKINKMIKENDKNKNVQIKIPVFGMVKDNKHQTRALMDENRQELEISENLMNLITRFQDTVHDTAISYHRKLRNKDITKSELDDIEGIGEVKKKALLKEFGSVEKIKKASIEELMKVKGISRKIAEEILKSE